MAANTRSAWTEKRVGYTSSSLYIAECTVLAAVANWNAYTVKTPRGLDVRRPWTLVAYYSADPDPSDTAVLSLWGGYSDDFVVANTSGMTAAATATDGAKVKQLLDDCTTIISTLPYVGQLTPNCFDDGGAVADVVTIAAIATGLKARIPLMPYYSIGIDSGSVLAAETGYYKIIQAKG
jgi:hypothetical protein